MYWICLQTATKLPNQPDTWVKKLFETSQYRWQKNDWAKHWFHRFLAIDDDVKAWAAFRLFLHCVDTRFWHWQMQLKAAVPEHELTPKRLDFLQDNLETIKNRIRKNEKPLRKQYLGHKILEDQAWPWMSTF